MDELEISGKRFISTKRAAKEHKYHADYIGQLIRGSKVEGQKVGRAWYVNAKSLAAYLNKEKGEEAPIEKSAEEKEAPVPVVEKNIEKTVEEKVEEAEPTPVVTESAVVTNTDEETPNHVVVRVEEKSLQEKSPITIKEEVRRVHFQPKEKPSLVYLSDDEPTLPQLSKKEIAATKSTQNSVVTPIVQKEAEQTLQEKSHAGKVARVIILACVGIVVFITVAATSVALSTTLVVEEGKTATVGFSLN